MSLKAELETWAAALKAYDENDYEKSLDLFSRIADSSKILTNMGLIYATLGEHELAVEQFISATGLDQYLAVAYFQCGVSNFLLARYELSHKDFEEALLYLRGNESINYEQLGLKFKLYSAEVLFNKGLSQIYMGNVQQGIADMEEARREKATEEHNVIDDAIQDRGEGYTVFSIPVGVLYRPSEKKLKNVSTKDYLGKAKLVAAADSADAFTTFTGSTLLMQGRNMSGAYVDQPPTLSAAAAAARVPKPDEGGGGAGLARAKTTLNVPADREARIAGLSAGGPPAGGDNGGPPAPASGAGVSRSASAGATPVGMPGPVRGLSVRKPPTNEAPPDRDLAARIDRLALDDSPAPTPPPTGPPPPTKGPRVTEFYDNYLDSYTNDDDEAPPMPPVPVQQPDRVAQWARNNADPRNNNDSPRRAPSSASRPPPSTYAPSSYGGGGTIRRKLTRRNTSRGQSRAQSSYGQYEEEEEGYASGDYDDMIYELVKIRVKLHYQDDVRGMALTPETSFDEFVDKVTAKFGKRSDGMQLKFKDEDGGKVSLRDDMDYELAIETARESARGKPEGKLEVWCSDI